jgi:hypothetical protein
LLLSDQGGGIFERNLAMPGPAQRRSSMREGLAFPVNYRPTTAHADDRRMAPRGDMTLLCPLRLLGNR